MTLPGGAGDVSTTEWGITGNDGTIPGQANNTQGNVTDVLKGRYTNPAGTTAWRTMANALYSGLDASLPLPQATVQPTFNAIVEAFGGFITGINYGLSHVFDVFTNKANVQAQHTAQIAALQQIATQHANGGTNVFYDFTAKANSANFPSEWTQTYVGTSATGTWGFKDGSTSWYPVNDNPRDSWCVYDLAETTTDFQLIGAVFADTPGVDILGNHSYNFLLGRSNSDGSTCVQAKFGSNVCKLEFVQNRFGTSPVVTSLGPGASGFSFKSSASYFLLCGTTAGIDSYIVLENSTPIYQFTDSSHIASAANGRRAGAGVRTYANIFEVLRPASLLAFMFCDNTPPPVIGSGFRACRTLTGTSSVSANTNVLPNGFYDTVTYRTDEYTWDALSANKVTVSKDGWYLVNFNAHGSGVIAAGGGGSARATLWKNGSVFQHGPSITHNINSGFNGFGGAFIVYLNAGDYIQPGYDTSGWTMSNAMIGESTGTRSYLEVALINCSLA